MAAASAYAVVAEKPGMKVIVAGCRDFHDYDFVVKAIEDSGFKIAELVSGGAKGVDALGEKWAHENDVPVKIFEADWRMGRGAGPLRNGRMAKYASALVAVWDSKSPGTKSMIHLAEQWCLEVHVSVIVKTPR